MVDVPVIMQPAFLQCVLVPQAGHSHFATVTGAENCGGSAVAVLPGVAQCFVRQWMRALRQIEEWLLEEFQVFPRDWVDSAPEVNFRPALLLERSGRARRRPLQVACFLLVLLVFMHLALCSRRLLTRGMEKYAQSMLRPPSSVSLETWTIFL